jgi:hypothetical protein
MNLLYYIAIQFYNNGPLLIYPSLATTLDLYSHVSPGLQQQAADAKFDSIFTPGSGRNLTLSNVMKCFSYAKAKHTVKGSQ